MTASHILLQVTCFNATESDFQNFGTNWTNFRTLSEFQDISGHFLKFQEFQDRAQACVLAVPWCKTVRVTLTFFICVCASM